MFATHSNRSYRLLLRYLYASIAHSHGKAVHFEERIRRRLKELTFQFQEAEEASTGLLQLISFKRSSTYDILLII